jgi:hypothetical protein
MRSGKLLLITQRILVTIDNSHYSLPADAFGQGVKV